MKIIDVHSHFICSDYLNGIKCHDKENEDGFPMPKWSVENHLKYMQQVGIETCLLSVSSPHFYFGDMDETIQLAKKIDEYASSCKRKYPDAFLFAASLPVPDIQASIKHVKYAYDILGADAIKLPSNANGMYLGDKRYDPLFAALNQRKSIILIHPTAPQSYPKDCFTSKVLPLFEFLGDTTRSIIDLIVSGMLEKYPNVKIIVPHCGSFLPNTIHRLEGITKALGKPVQVNQSLKSLYFDVAGDVSGLKFLLIITDEDHLLFGGDFPYTPQDQIQDKISCLENSEEMVSIMDKLMHKNAEKLFFGYKKIKK